MTRGRYICCPQPLHQHASQGLPETQNEEMYSLTEVRSLVKQSELMIHTAFSVPAGFPFHADVQNNGTPEISSFCSHCLGYESCPHVDSAWLWISGTLFVLLRVACCDAGIRVDAI